MHRYLTSVAIALACCGVVRAQSTQPTTQVTTPPADVPITAIKLFSSGVGYFERGGLVHGDDHTTLSFKADQINDILKSLVLQDENGGTLGTITYPSQDPLEKSLAGFSIDVSNNQSLLDLLTQLRGAHLTLSFGPERISGVLVSTESKDLPGSDEKHPVTAQSLTILSGTMIRSIPLSGVRDIQLNDPQLQTDFAAALTTLAGARNQDRKPLDIAFHGNGERHVRIGYVVESPVWKTSYRLVLDGDKPHLQGWAMVENQTDSDWNHVQLSLVSGRPISFIENLYSPIYLPRPTVQPELFGGVQPPEADRGGADGNMGMKKALSATLADSPAAPAAGALFGRGGGGESAPIDPLQSIVAIANAASLGELFSYTIGDVSLHRHESAMVPIVTDAVDAQRISIFSQLIPTNHPLNGVRIKNTTDTHLLQGPVTIFDHSSYAGDAQLDNLPPNQSRLLSYGIDLEMTVSENVSTRNNTIQSATIDQGMLNVTHRSSLTHVFNINNKSNAARTLIIEDTVGPDWSLIDTPKPVEIVGTENRFQMDVPAGAATTFVVKQQMDQGERIEILSNDEPTYLQYISSTTIAKPVRDALSKANDLRNVANLTQLKITGSNAKIKAIADEQTRIRDNMKAIDQKSDYYSRLLKKLDEQETQIEKLQTDTVDQQKLLIEEKKALSDYIGNLHVQ